MCGDSGEEKKWESFSKYYSDGSYLAGVVNLKQEKEEKKEIKYETIKWR